MSSLMHKCFMSSDRLYLQHIVDAIESIEEYLRGKKLEDLFANKMLLDAVVREIEIVGEASNHLSEKFGKEHPELPLTDMRSMRNKLIHEYFTVDPKIVWQTYEEDLPVLKGKIVSILI